MKRKLGINSECISGVSSEDTLNLIRDAGFDCYFTDKYHLSDAEPVYNRGLSLGLECEFIHAPFKEINSMWYKTDEHPNVYIRAAETIDTAAALQIPTVIIHTTSGWNPPEINDKGLHRFDLLVERAAKRGVTLAFENLRKVGIVSYMLDRYRNFNNVSFCYDVGHEFCYTNGVDWIGIAKRKINCTHIHDNLGQTENPEIHDDMHLLPFDGKIDYENMIKRLDAYSYYGSLMLEVFNNSKEEYAKMSAEEFIGTAYERLKKIADYSK